MPPKTTKRRRNVCVDCEDPTAPTVRITPMDQLPRCQECRRKLAQKLLMKSMRQKFAINVLMKSVQ